MLVVFLLDTSASMNQRCANGLSLLDCAKSAVEHFHKVRSRDASCRVDRYMLVTCEDGPNCIKAVDKYPFTHFMRALKSIQARDLTNIGAAMQRIFSFLHVQRLAVDIDRFGQGRNPCSIDPTTIMLLTDGTELTTLAGVTQSLLQNGPSPVGADLSSQPFRWDQRVFATVLRIPSVSPAVLERSGPIPQNAPISGSQTALAMDTIISAFCEFTGGKCFVATSWKVLMQHTEVTATRLPACVIVSFEHMPLPGSQTLPPQVQAACQRKMLLVRGGQAQQGHWPIPEAFWPDPAHPGIPPREPHPTIAYKAVDADPFIPTNFICDKYEIESNPIMGFLLKAPAAVCWQVYVRNSKGTNHGYGDPFGYLRLNRGGTTLTLVVLPYNYPVLWQLLEQGGKVPGTAKMPPLPQWRQDMERYCNSIPSYYGAPLRTALKRWGLSAHVVPEAMENSLIAGFVGTQLKRLKMQAKADLDEDMKRILTEQQLLGTTLAGATATLQGRTLPLMPFPPTAEAPPGFTAGMTSGAVNNVSGSVSAPQQARGMAHGDQTNGRKGWESVIPSGPSSTSGPPAVSGGYVGPVPVAGAAYGSGLGISNNDSSSSANNVGVMKDITLFKNPFDVSRDQLLRQLRYLPIRIAVAMDARQNRRMERDIGKGKSSAISILAARIAAKEEDEARHSLPIEKMGDFNEALMKQQPPRNPFIDEQDRSKQQRTMFGNPYRQEKNDGADEAWLEGQGPGGPLFRGRKRRRRSESPGVSNSSLSGTGSAADGNSEAASANAEVTSPARTLPEAQGAEGLQGNSNPEGNKAVERPSDVGLSDSQDAAPVADSRGSPAPDSDMGDGGMDAQRNSFSSGADKQSGPTFLESSAAASERLDQTSGETAAGLEKLDSGSEEMSRSLRKRRVVVCTPSGTEKDRDEVINFLLTIVKALRYSKASNTQKLFELLSSPDFPVDKTNFLEQLILQAQRYNKVSVAKELVDYRNQLTTNASSVTVTVSERA